MDLHNRKHRAWIWGIAGGLLLSLSGCAMYPTHPGMWPSGFWGSILKAVSATIDFFAHILWNNYGLGLLAATVLVRLLILPLMMKQIRTSKMMQELQPELRKIQQKYKGDTRKQQEELAKLYQSRGVNPMAGCLPALIQLPILTALFGAIEGNIKLNQSTFLGIFHLGAADHYYILPLIAAVTTYFSSRMMMTGNDPQQKMMLLIMPVFIFLMGSRFPSGLALYWVYGNIFTLVQGYFVNVRPRRLAKANE